MGDKPFSTRAPTRARVSTRSRARARVGQIGGSSGRPAASQAQIRDVRMKNLAKAQRALRKKRRDMKRAARQTRR